MFEYAVTAPPGLPLPSVEPGWQPALHAPGGRSTTHTGRDGFASPVIWRSCANAAASVPSPVGAGYAQVTLQIVTAMFGIVFEPVLRTASTRWLCSDRRCEAGKVAVATATGKFPLGSLASWRAPPPHADRTSAVSAPQIRPRLLQGTARRT